MDKIVIHGGKKLKGRIRISGSKNAALPILFASLLTNDRCVVTNVPELADIRTAVKLLEHINKNVEWKGSKVVITSKEYIKPDAPYDLVRRMRASCLVMGPLIARVGKVCVSLPGGCAIGSRPIDIHLDSFKKLGAKIALREGNVQMKAENLKGARIKLRFPSVGATENILLAAVLAKGTTVLENAAKEPEITDLAVVLKKMGADIRGAGTSKITIEGVDKLRGFNHDVIPDRIETATYMIAAGITKGDVVLENTDISLLKKVADDLKKTGLKVESKEKSIHVRWVRPLKPVSVATKVYPGFPTDVQAQWMALMSVVKGTSRVKEDVFESRMAHVLELERLGADIKLQGNKVTIRGVENLSGAPVMVSDLRAGAALVIAGLVAAGKSEILRIYHLDRGYEHLEKKLRKLGADIKRVSD